MTAMAPVNRQAKYVAQPEPTTTFTVNVLVSTPDPTGDGFTLEFGGSPLVHYELEDRMVEAVRNAVLQRLESEGGIPVGGLFVGVSLELPPSWAPSRHVEDLLPDMIAFFTVTSVRLALDSQPA